MGFTSYAQERRARVEIQKEFADLSRREIWEYGKLAPRSTLMLDFLQAKAIIGGYSPKTIQRAAHNRESLLGRTTKGRAVRDRLRTALGFGAKAFGFYYPVMRSLY